MLGNGFCSTRFRAENRGSLMVSFQGKWRATRSRCVLLVDDDPGIARSCQQILILRGHEVIVAKDGEEAVDIAKTLRPDVVICDLGLPGMDGFAVVKALRSNPGTRHAAIGMLTGQSAARDLALQSGCDEFFLKPVPLAELLDFVECWG